MARPGPVAYGIKIASTGEVGYKNRSIRPPRERGVPNENVTEGLHPDRTDDRGRDHRHSGGGCAASISGLHDPREDVRSDSRDELLPYVDHRGVSVGSHDPACGRWLGLRDSHRLAADEVRCRRAYGRP